MKRQNILKKKGGLSSFSHLFRHNGLLSGLLYCMLAAVVISLSFLPDLTTDLALAETSGTGQVSIYVFEGGAPIHNVEIADDTGRTYHTNSEGSVVIKAPAGEHTIRVTRGSDTWKKTVRIFSDEESVYFFSINGGVLLVDAELPSQYKKLESQTASSDNEEKTSEQMGKLKLQIISAEGGTPIEKARIFVKGSPVECLTDKDGVCILDLPQGTYSLSVIHPDFNSRTLDKIVVAHETIERIWELSPSGFELKDFVVLAPSVKGSIAAMLFEEKNVADIVDAIGSEEFKRTGDSTAAAAVKRVTGITVVDGKYVYIRGLGGRYSVTLLNNALLPSPEPTKRVIPLDIFPTGVLESLLVKKSFTPDFPASFAGGALILNARDIPDAPFANMSLEMKYNSRSTFKDGLSYDGGSHDWTGFDDGTRDQPFPVKDIYDYKELKEYALKFDNNSDTHDKTLPPGGKYSLNLGYNHKINDFKLGFTTSGMYENKWNLVDVTRNIYSASDAGLILNNGGIYSNTVNTVEMAGFQGAGINYRDKHALKYTGLYTRTVTDRTQLFNGTDENSNRIRTTSLMWQQRDLLFNQFSGKHNIDLLTRMILDWNVVLTTAKMEMPDTRSYTYWFIERDSEPGGGYYELVNIPGQNLTHEYTNLKDKGHEYKVDLTFPFEKYVEGNLKAGWQEDTKDRIYSVNRYTFDSTGRVPRDLLREDIDTIFAPENVEQYYIMRNQTYYNDTYSGKLDINAWYLSANISPFEWFRIQGGNRFEKLDEQVTSYKLLSPTPINSRIKINASYPSIGTTFKISDDMQIRAAYSKTMTYPDFLELSNSIYIDPLTSERIIGNPDLKASKLENYDLRWEWYFATLDHVSLAFFYKTISNPIEQTYKATSNRPFLSFMNADDATIIGGEMEFSKGLGFISDWLSYVHLGGNFALIDSEVNIKDKGILTTGKRALQGQSSYVINVQIGYDNPDSGTNITLLYNTFGKRIRGVGIFGQPDQYQQPFNQLDLVCIQKFLKKYTLTFKVQNLLDDSVKITQGDETFLEFKKGIDLTLSVGYKF